MFYPTDEASSDERAWWWLPEPDSRVLLGEFLLIVHGNGAVWTGAAAVCFSDAALVAQQ